MSEALKKTLNGKAEVLDGLPQHPAVKAVLAWNPEGHCPTQNLTGEN